MHCLDRRALAFTRLADNLATADPGLVEGSVNAIHGLAAVSDCEADALAMQQRVASTSDPRVAAEVAEIRELMASAESASLSGSVHEAAQILDSVIERARRLARADLLAELHLQYVRDPGGLGGGGRMDHIRAALEHAVAAGRPDLAARAAELMFFTGAYESSHFSVGAEYLRLQESLVRAADDPPEELAGLHFNTAVWEGIGGDHEASLAAMFDALAVARESFPEQSFPVAKAVGNVADSLGFNRNFEAEISYRQSALDILVELVGPSHPRVLVERTRLVLPYLDMGRLDVGMKLAREVRDDCHRLHGPDSPSCVDALAHTIRASRALGHLADLQRDLGELQRIQTGAGSRVRGWLAWAEEMQAGLELAQGRPEQAKALAERAIELTAAESHVSSTSRAGPHVVLARVWVVLGDTGRALRELETARDIMREPSPNAGMLEFRMDIAHMQALVEAGKAREAAELAAERFGGDQGSGSGPADVEVNPRALAVLSKVYGAAGQLDTARSMALQVIERQAEIRGAAAHLMVEPWLALGDIEWQRGALEAADEAYAAADSSFSDGPLESHMRAPMDFGRARVMAALAERGRAEQGAVLRARQLAIRALHSCQRWGRTRSKLAREIKHWLAAH